MTLTEAQGMLPSRVFFKIHKSYPVNLSHTQKIERHRVAVSNGDEVPLAGTYREALLESLR